MTDACRRRSGSTRAAASRYRHRAPTAPGVRHRRDDHPDARRAGTRMSNEANAHQRRQRPALGAGPRGSAAATRMAGGERVGDTESAPVRHQWPRPPSVVAAVDAMRRSCPEANLDQLVGGRTRETDP